MSIWNLIWIWWWWWWLSPDQLCTSPGLQDGCGWSWRRRNVDTFSSQHHNCCIRLNSRGSSFPSTNRSPSRSRMLIKISVNSPWENLNVSWKKIGSNSCVWLMGPIFQVLSRGRSSNIYRNTHGFSPETTPVPKPLLCTMKTRSWRFRVRTAPDTMSVVINLLTEHCNINKTCRKFVTLLLCFLTMTFWHTDNRVGFLPCPGLVSL